MSHFTVMVIGDDVDSALEPFQENNMDTCSNEYLQFIPIDIDRYKDQYDNRSTIFASTGSFEVSMNQYRKIRKTGKLKLRLQVVNTYHKGCKPNKLYSTYVKQYADGLFTRDVTLTVCYAGQMKSTSYIATMRCIKVLNNSVIMELVHNPSIKPEKFNEHYSSFQEYMEYYNGYKYHEDQKAYGYWDNPNAKWDWYQIGGRWSGQLAVKPGSTSGTVGNPSWFNLLINEEKITNGKVDSCQLKDLDTDAMIEDAKQQQVKWLAQADTEYENGTPINIIKFRFGVDPTNNEDREQYLKDYRLFTPYAIVHEGEWIAQGEMGWFGCSIDEYNEEEWSSKLWDKIKSLDPETRITVVDCHI